MPDSPPNETKQITVEYFTDVLCVWAYGAQVRLDQLQRDFGDQVRTVYRFLPLFGATDERIRQGWNEHGGHDGFNRHVRAVASAWSHVEVHPRVWLEDAPASSTPAHLFLKTVQLLEQRGELHEADSAGREVTGKFELAAWQVRRAFFSEARNIAHQAVLEDIASALKLPLSRIRRLLENGEAHAALQQDVEAKERYQVPGSPTLVLNEGRQRLYGNIGYRVIEANVQELLRDPRYGEASWC